MSKTTVCLALSCALAATAHAEAPARPPATIVLVHGAFADGSSWDRVIPLLEARGYHVVAVYDPMSSLADDVAATMRVIDAQPGPVILVGHSYGGAVITEAGNDPKVTALVYVAAFAPDSGESINDLGEGQPPPPWVTELVVDSGGFATLPAEVVAGDFAQDLGPFEIRLLAAKQGPIALRCFDDRIRAAAWRTRPTWYVRAEADHMIAPAAQLAMAQRAHAKLTSVRASHVVLLSRPREVAAAILAAASSARSW